MRRLKERSHDDRGHGHDYSAPMRHYERDYEMDFDRGYDKTHDRGHDRTHDRLYDHGYHESDYYRE